MLRLLRRALLVLVVIGWVLVTRDMLFKGAIEYWMQWVLLIAALLQSAPWVIERWRE
jgi:hypothetical protein